MATILFCRGDMFAGSPEAIAHGCNIKGAMGKGVAVAVKERFPEMYEKYYQACEEKKLQLGDIFVSEEKLDDKPVVVYNLMTQEAFNGASMKAVSDSVKAMCKDAEERGIKAINMPLIASCNGKLTPSTAFNLLSMASIEYKGFLNVVVAVADNEAPKPIMERQRDYNRPMPVNVKVDGATDADCTVTELPYKDPNK